MTSPWRHVGRTARWSLVAPRASANLQSWRQRALLSVTDKEHEPPTVTPPKERQLRTKCHRHRLGLKCRRHLLPSIASGFQVQQKCILCVLICRATGAAAAADIYIAELQRRIQAFEMRCHCKILRISYRDHVTNEEVRAKIQQAIGPHENLLTIVKRRKLQWYGHISRSSGPAKTILQGTVKRGRRQGRQKKTWEDNIREWTGL